MADIIIKDSLRAVVEAQSGGAQTVLYTPKGQPTFMNIIPKFDVSTIAASLGSGVHPAFIMGDKTLDALYVGTYQSALVNGELVSQPYQAPTIISPALALSLIKSLGAGFHPITQAEYGMLLALEYKSQKRIYGNANLGNSKDTGYEGQRLDGAVTGVEGGTNNLIFTGSGPRQFRMGHLFNGISDLGANGYTIPYGMRIAGTEMQFLSLDNSAANLTKNFAANSTDWKALDAAALTLVTPTGTGTLGVEGATGDYAPTTSNSLRCTNTKGSEVYALQGDRYPAQAATVGDGGSTPLPVATLQKLRQLGIITIDSAFAPYLEGTGWNPTVGAERFPFRGNTPTDKGKGNMTANTFYFHRGVAGTSRVCYYKP